MEPAGAPGERERESPVGGVVGDAADQQRHRRRREGSEGRGQQDEAHREQRRGNDTDRAETHELLAERPAYRFVLGRFGIGEHADGQRSIVVREATHHAPDAGEVTARRGDDVDAAVAVVDPVDGNLVDAQPAVLGEDEQLRVEEPPLVGDEWQQLMHGVAAYRLEAALRIRETGVQGSPQQQVVAA